MVPWIFVYSARGNRRGRTRQIWNLFVVWSLTGLWHGASWNFVLWGIYYFILLTIEKIFLGEKLEQLPGWLQHGYTCLIVLFGWVIFANENIADLGRYFLTMFGANGALYNQTAIYQWYTHIPLLIVLIIGSTKLPKQLLRKGWTRLKLIDAISSHQEQIRFVAASIFTVLVLYCSVAFLVSGSYNPFCTSDFESSIDRRAKSHVLWAVLCRGTSAEWRIRMKRHWYMIYFGLIIGGLFTLGITMLIRPAKHFSENENRVLQQIPAFSLNSFVQENIRKN